MYEFTNHIHMFRSVPSHLFRGARLTDSYDRRLRRPDVTATSIDPIVATLFAAKQRSAGDSYVLILDKEKFKDAKLLPSIRTFASQELAVNIEMGPDSVEKEAMKIIPISRSLQILRKMKHDLPAKLSDENALCAVLESETRLFPDEIELYSKLALEK